MEFYPKILSTQALTRGNGINSGSSSVKLFTKLEDNPYLLRKMKSFVAEIKDGLIK